jgi:arylsulfatase A-like enzyme
MIFHSFRHSMALLFCVVVIGAAGRPALALPAAEKAGPNVIILFTDDQGSVDAACYGSRDLVTPGMDSLAARGVRFTQFYSAAPVCSPSRAALLTGRYPWLAGMPNNAPSPPSEADDQLETLTGDGLPAKEITLADMFRAAGYATAHIGKWHLGSGAGHRPLDHGFDYSFGFMGGCIDNYSHFSYWGGPNREDLWENNRRVRMPGRFFPDLMVEKAEAFISSHRDRPFFMYFAMNMPHYPYQGDARWLDYYSKLGYPRNLYAAFISTLDDHLRELFKYLDESGLRDKTIIVFQSDNGHSVEERAHYGGGSSGPYRGAKFSVFEGGIRLPAMISWPGHLPEGVVRTQIAHGCDWMPTLAELCGVPLPNAHLTGRSLASVIFSADAPSPHDVLQWMSGKQWAVREGPWKLLHNPNDTADDAGHKLAPADRTWFLVNTDNDIGERTNLARLHPDMVERMRKLAPTDAN